MAIPESAKKIVPRKCPICNIKCITKADLVKHIEKKHKDQIPKDWSAARYENYLRTNATCGHCTECKGETTWNESTWKYNRICTNPKCRKSVSDRADKNCIGKYGKVHLLNDPEMQRKMIYAKKTSGVYYWADDEKKKFPSHYASQEELKFLEMLDAFLNFSPEDVISPSPHTYTYQYDGKEHFYIPDHYIVSLNLEVENKEPLNNQNMHPKIQAVDKVKEKLKDELMESVTEVNYIKINGTDYSGFFALLSRLKDQDYVINASKTSRVLESLLDMVDTDEFDFDVSDLLNEAMEEPILEKIQYREDHTLDRIMINIIDRIDNTNDVINPGLNYNGLMKRLERMIKTCPVEDLPKADDYLTKVEEEFDREIKYSEDHNNSDEMEYELKKSLDKIQTRLRPMLDSRMRAIKECTYTMMETLDYNEWFYIEEALHISANKNDVQYKPVFVFLSFTDTPLGRIIRDFTKSPYSHSSLSFDTELKSMCSFGSDKTGHMGYVSDESIYAGGFTNNNAYYALYMYMAPKDEYNAMKQAVNQFNSMKDDLKYSIKGLLNIAMGKESNYSTEFFCSEFVSKIITTGNPKLLKKHFSLYTPGDLSNTHKLLKIDSGLIKDYSSDKVDRKITKALAERGYSNVKIKR